jgi:hypothetical protein
VRKAGVWVSVTMLAASGMVWAGINGAVDDHAVAVQGHPVVIDVHANDLGVGGLRGLMIRSRPAHGSASVVGGRIRYAPRPGFTGRDRFSYIVVGAGGTGTATVSVDVGEGLVLRGGVPEGVLAGAAVTASVGATEFTTQTDADGRYVLRIASPENGMVKLEVRGAAEQSHVRLVSLVGDLDRLIAQAGSDGVLTREENNQVQVGSLGTAHARLLLAANEGAAIHSDAQMDAARESMDYPQLLRQAGAVRLAIPGVYELPAGTEDTFALISDRTALADFIAYVNRINANALPNAIAELVADPELIVLQAADGLVGRHALMFHQGPPGALNMQYLQGHRMTLDAGGSGHYVTATPNSDPSVAWSSGSGMVDVTPNHPLSTQLYRSLPPTFRQFRALLTPVGYRVTKLFEGGGSDTWAVATTQVYTYPDNPEYPPETVTNVAAAMAIEDGAGTDPILPAEVIGTRTLWIPRSHTNLPPPSSGGSELFGFFPNGTGQRSYGQPLTFTWSIDPQGALLVNVNGETGRFLRLKRDGREGEGLLGEWSSGNTRSARFAVSAMFDGFLFDPSSAQRAWRSGFTVGTSSVEPNGELMLILDPDGIGWQRDVLPTGEVFLSPRSWRSANGGVEILTYRNASNQPVRECEVGVNGCRITMIRRWEPIARNGDRVYVLEELVQDSDGNGSIELDQQRTNYYDEVTRPSLPSDGAGVLPAAPTPAKAASRPSRIKKTTPPAPRAAPAQD